MKKIKKSTDSLKDWFDIYFIDVLDNIIDEYNDTNSYSDFDFQEFFDNLCYVAALDNISVLDMDIINKLSMLNFTTKLEYISKFVSINDRYIVNIKNSLKLLNEAIPKLQSVLLILLQNNKDLKKTI